jgi:hypothetical protein
VINSTQIDENGLKVEVEKLEPVVSSFKIFQHLNPNPRTILNSFGA